MSYNTQNQGAVTRVHSNGGVVLTAGGNLEFYDQSFNQGGLKGTSGPSGPSGILGRTSTFSTLENVPLVNKTPATYFKASSINN